MGETRVSVTIRNPAARRRSWEGDFLVDTGAIDSVVPRRHLEAIGIYESMDLVGIGRGGGHKQRTAALC